MDIWVSDKVENELRKDGWTIPVRPKEGPVFFKDKEVGFADNFVGLSIENDKQEALRYLVDNETRLGYALWNIPKIERLC
jgi:hypothetical protein